MNLKIISLNVNSFVREERKHLLNNFIANKPAEIYLLQETKLKSLSRISTPALASSLRTTDLAAVGLLS